MSRSYLDELASFAQDYKGSKATNQVAGDLSQLLADICKFLNNDDDTLEEKSLKERAKILGKELKEIAQEESDEDSFEIQEQDEDADMKKLKLKYMLSTLHS